MALYLWHVFMTHDEYTNNFTIYLVWDGDNCGFPYGAMVRDNILDLDRE